MRYYENVDFTFKSKSPDEYVKPFLGDVMYIEYLGKIWKDITELVFIKGNRINVKMN